MEQFDARMKSLLKDEYDYFKKKALLEKPVKGLYLNRNKKNVERVLNQNYVEHHPIVENGYLYDENYHQEEVLISLQDFIISRNQVRCL